MNARSSVSVPTQRPFLMRLWQSISRMERRIIVLFVFVGMISAGLLGYQLWLANTEPVAVPGGSYAEGIVASSVTDISSTIDVLTKVGFVRYDEQRSFAPAAAERWEISEEGKLYTFFMRRELDTAVVRQALEESQKLFPEIETEVTDDHRVVFRLKQSFTPFLATTAEPIFPVGPYDISERDRGLIRLKPRPNALFGQPNLQEITLKIYPDSFNLTEALAAGDIQGVSDVSSVENPVLSERLTRHEIVLPRKMYLFFNTERESVKSAEVRRRLRDGQGLEQPIQLKMVTLSGVRHERLAQDIVSRWEKLGVTVLLESRTTTELAKDVVPQRDFDVLIYGLDFGGDPDPYPFWHSSQISEKGLNLANFANIDADRLLEKARQTTNVQERESLYRSFNEIFEREVPAFELEGVSIVFGIDPELQGAHSHPGLSIANRYDDVVDWYRKIKRVKKE